MRKLIAILFLLVFTVGTTEAAQLIRLPLLIEHYNDHMKEGRSDSFIDFFAEHYIDYHGEDEDKQEDDSLPFKAVNPQNVSVTFFMIPFSFNSTISAIRETVLIEYATPFELPGKTADIFHPPRLA